MFGHWFKKYKYLCGQKSFKCHHQISKFPFFIYSNYLLKSLCNRLSKYNRKQWIMVKNNDNYIYVWQISISYRHTFTRCDEIHTWSVANQRAMGGYTKHKLLGRRNFSMINWLFRLSEYFAMPIFKFWFFRYFCYVKLYIYMVINWD